MKAVHVVARDLPDAWYQLNYEILRHGYVYKIDRGSMVGHERIEFDFVTVQVKHPGIRPIIPDIPPGMGITPPTDMEYVESYMEKLITDMKSVNETYTYGEDLAKQVPRVIEMYKSEGFNTNQAFMAVGNADSIALDDPQCLRAVDTRIRYGKLHFILYFRSWDLWNGLPANLAGLQLLKEYMAEQIGIEDGEMIASSKGMHLYDYTWDQARCRTNTDLTDEDLRLRIKDK